jgi:arylsulfatase A-like enzyme
MIPGAINGIMNKSRSLLILSMRVSKNPSKLSYMTFNKFFFLLFLPGFICFKGKAQQDLDPPNILWITVEDIDPAWGCYGDEYAHTPNIDKIAAEGYIFTQAFSNSPICAPARSTLITGMYATSLGTQHLRSEVPIPQDLKILPEIMRDHGYYTTNNVKTDYNFDPEGRWDENSQKAHWRNKPWGKPFFSVFNFTMTHEGQANHAFPDQLTEELTNKHDPAKAKLPPYFPDTPNMREIWAHQYDLISVFDQEVGNLIAQLKEDGLYENTIIFLFSDHGFGLPRHKRWLNNSGLQIPFVLYVPEQYKHLASNLTEKEIADKVAFVDFAPTVIELAGAQPSPYMEGINFLGTNSKSNEFIYGFRSRADDCYDMSRSIYDGRYLYIRHYNPHLPYIQKAVIFDSSKQSMAEIYRQKELGNLPTSMDQYFNPKPTVELYDLQKDPFELTNLAGEPVQEERMKSMQDKLNQWMIKHKDSGLINEAEYMQKAEGSSVYKVLRDKEYFDPAKVIKVMNRVGKVDTVEEISKYLRDEDPMVRYWGLLALEAYGKNFPKAQSDLIGLLDDSSPINGILSAKLLVRHLDYQAAFSTLEKYLKSNHGPTVLYAAIAVRLLEEKAMPLIPVIQEDIFPRFEGEIWNRYKNWIYPMFIGMALDQARMNCGEEIEIKK